MLPRNLSSLVLLLLATQATLHAAEDEPWSRFRGPNGSGVAEVSGLPDTLDPEVTLVWRTELPPGHSSPILSETRVFLTAIDDGELKTIALDRHTGKILWERSAPRPREELQHGKNNPAAPSPVVSGDEVVVFFPEFGLLAYDHAGEELWRLELGPFNNVYGMGASPVVVGDDVVLACDQGTGSFLLALNKRTGALHWRSERPQAKSSHCTPILTTATDGATELLLPGSFLLDAYDVTTGEKRWYASGLCFEMKSVPVIANGLVIVNGYGSPMNQPGNQITVPPFAEVLASNDADEDGLITPEEMPATRAASWFDFVDLDVNKVLDEPEWEYLVRALASQNGMLAFTLGGSGDRSDTALEWSYRRSVPQLPSPLVFEDVLYMLNDSGGLLTTLAPSTGKLIERGRLEGGIDTYYASPVAGDGKVYIISESGRCVVLPAGGSLEPLSVTDLQENVYATPALSDGRVYLRTTAALYCFGS